GLAAHSALPQSMVGHAVSVAAWVHTPVAHVWHAPAQAVLQHTPSTQLLLLHSEPLAHASPLALLGCEQLPASSHTFLALQDWPALRASPWQSCAPVPQPPAMQRCVVTLGGKSRQVVS